MTIYRKPGSNLDHVVRSKMGDVHTIFSDARLSENEMRSLADRVIADISYWWSDGIHVTGAGPLADGSAVKVSTTDGGEGESQRLSERYGQPIVVERAQPAMAPYLGHVPSHGSSEMGPGKTEMGSSGG
jgi:hypothetical protein